MVPTLSPEKGAAEVLSHGPLSWADFTWHYTLKVSPSGPWDSATTFPTLPQQSGPELLSRTKNRGIVAEERVRSVKRRPFEQARKGGRYRPSNMKRTSVDSPAIVPDLAIQSYTDSIPSYNVTEIPIHSRS